MSMKQGYNLAKLPINKPTDKNFKPSKKFGKDVDGLVTRAKNL